MSRRVLVGVGGRWRALKNAGACWWVGGRWREWVERGGGCRASFFVPIQGLAGLAGAEFPGCGWDVWSAADARLFFCVRFGRCGRVFGVDSERGAEDAASPFFVRFGRHRAGCAFGMGRDGWVGCGNALNLGRRDGMVGRCAADEWGLYCPEG